MLYVLKFLCVVLSFFSLHSFAKLNGQISTSYDFLMNSNIELKPNDIKSSSHRFGTVMDFNLVQGRYFGGANLALGYRVFDPEGIATVDAFRDQFIATGSYNFNAVVLPRRLTFFMDGLARNSDTWFFDGDTTSSAGSLSGLRNMHTNQMGARYTKPLFSRMFFQGSASYGMNRYESLPTFDTDTELLSSAITYRMSKKTEFDLSYNISSEERIFTNFTTDINTVALSHRYTYKTFSLSSQLSRVTLFPQSSTNSIANNGYNFSFQMKVTPRVTLNVNLSNSIVSQGFVVTGGNTFASYRCSVYSVDSPECANHFQQLALRIDEPEFLSQNFTANYARDRSQSIALNYSYSHLGLQLRLFQSQSSDAFGFNIGSNNETDVTYNSFDSLGFSFGANYRFTARLGARYRFSYRERSASGVTSSSFNSNSGSLVSVSHSLSGRLSYNKRLSFQASIRLFGIDDDFVDASNVDDLRLSLGFNYLLFKK